MQLSTTNHHSSLLIWGKEQKRMLFVWDAYVPANIVFVTLRFGCWKQQHVSFMPRLCDWRSGAETAEELLSQTMNKSAGYKQWISNCFASFTIFTVYPKAPVPGIMPSHEIAGSHFLNLLLASLDTGTMLGNEVPAGLKMLRTTKKT